MAMIETKPQMYDLLARGRLGNHWPLYSVENAVAKLPPTDLVGLRWTRGPGGPCIPLIEVQHLLPTLSELRACGWDPKGFIVTKLPYVEDHTLLQGEVQRSFDRPGIDLTYSLVQKPMRVALRESTRHASGLHARAILEQHCDPGTLEDFWDLWDEFPDAIIEFTTYYNNYGITGKRNTVIWEVRNY